MTVLVIAISLPPHHRRYCCGCECRDPRVLARAPRLFQRMYRLYKLPLRVLVARKLYGGDVCGGAGVPFAAQGLYREHSAISTPSVHSPTIE